MAIETENLRLVPCDSEILKAILQGNAFLSKKIKAVVSENWTEFGIGAFQYALEKLKESEDDANWLGYLPIHKLDNKLIGSGGYKGKPTIEGEVEIGYEIIPEYRNRGLATEMAKGLIDHALQNKKVKSIIAHTLAKKNPSTSVLEKCGFKKVEEIEDPEDGQIWKWELKR